MTISELPGVMAAASVVIGLVATTAAQFRPLRRGRMLLDLVALVPE